VLSALIHTATKRIDVRPEGAERSPMGQYDTEPNWSASFRARLMEYRGGRGERRDRDETRSRSEDRYELLAYHVDVDGAPVELSQADVIRAVAPVLTPPGGLLLEVDGQPEKLNNGSRVIGWRAICVKVTETG
jgi:hypothetical protein